MKRVLMAMAVMAVMAGSVQAAQKTAAKKPGPVVHIPDLVDIECAIYRWAYRNWNPPSYMRSTGAVGKPQNKKAPVNPGELSE